MSEVTPRDREEKLLAAIAEGATGELPTPRNRKEKLLKEIYDNGGTGGGGGESTIAWRPTVDAEGNISWARTASTVKPATQNIMGPPGEKGDKGDTGDTGPQGPAGPQGERGADGVSPIITENVNNTDNIYRLDITTDTGTIITPNLKGGGSVSGGTAETTTYTNASYPDYTNVDLALDALFNKVYYVKPTCSLSASPSGGTFEIGTTITAPITFTWKTNKVITSQTLTGCTLADESVRTTTYNTNVTSDKTFTLSVSDGENSASSSVSYKFLNKVYYGSASEPDIYDSAFILGLANNKFATTIKGSYPITVGSGQFGYIACPKSFNAPPECYIGGFLTTLENAGEISFTNASGGVATYIILKTGKSGLGSLTMEFK